MFDVDASLSSPAAAPSTPSTPSDGVGYAAAQQAARLAYLQEFATVLAPDLLNSFAFIAGALQLQAVELGRGMEALPWFTQALEMANKGAAKSRDLLDYAGRQGWQTNRAPVTDLRRLLQNPTAALGAPSDAGADLTGPVAGQVALPDDLWLVVCDPAVISALVGVVYGAAQTAGIARSDIVILVQNVACAELCRLPAFAAPGRDYVRLCLTITTPAPCPFDLQHVLTPRFMLQPSALPVLHLAADYARIRRAGGDLIVRPVPATCPASGPAPATCSAVAVDLLLPRAKWLSADWYQPPG
jgi:hypothetical protein